jgi:hypothetical protein
LRFRTIANFGYFARAIKHMRFPTQTREGPHFHASIRAIVKHFLVGAQLRAPPERQRYLLPEPQLERHAAF